MAKTTWILCCEKRETENFTLPSTVSEANRIFASFFLSFFPILFVLFSVSIFLLPLYDDVNPHYASIAVSQLDWHYLSTISVMVKNREWNNKKKKKQGKRKKSREKPPNGLCVAPLSFRPFIYYFAIEMPSHERVHSHFLRAFQAPFKIPR